MHDKAFVVEGERHIIPCAFSILLANLQRKIITDIVFCMFQQRVLFNNVCDYNLNCSLIFASNYVKRSLPQYLTPGARNLPQKISIKKSYLNFSLSYWLIIFLQDSS